MKSKIKIKKQEPCRVSVSKLLKFLDWYMSMNKDTIIAAAQKPAHLIVKKASDYIYEYGQMVSGQFTTEDVIRHFKGKRVRLYIPYAKELIRLHALREKSSIWIFHHKPLSYLGKTA